MHSKQLWFKWQLAAIAYFISLASYGNTVTQSIREVETPNRVIEQLRQFESLHSFGANESFDSLHSNDTNHLSPEIDIAIIVNLGKEIWKLIEKNKPVVNILKDYADAVPRGVTGPFELSGFSELQFKSYRVSAENGLGMTLYDFTFTLVHQYNGNYNNKGHYLSTVSIIPSNVSVGLGYNVNIKVAKVIVTNIGTLEDPIASIVMEVTTNISSPFYQSIQSEMFQFRGDSAEIKTTMKAKK